MAIETGVAREQRKLRRRHDMYAALIPLPIMFIRLPWTLPKKYVMLMVVCVCVTDVMAAAIEKGTC